MWTVVDLQRWKSTWTIEMPLPWILTKMISIKLCRAHGLIRFFGSKTKKTYLCYTMEQVVHWGWREIGMKKNFIANDYSNCWHTYKYVLYIFTYVRMHRTMRCVVETEGFVGKMLLNTTINLLSWESLSVRQQRHNWWYDKLLYLFIIYLIIR